MLPPTPSRDMTRVVGAWMNKNCVRDPEVDVRTRALFDAYLKSAGVTLDTRRWTGEFVSSFRTEAISPRSSIASSFDSSRLSRPSAAWNMYLLATVLVHPIM